MDIPEKVYLRAHHLKGFAIFGKEYGSPKQKDEEFITDYSAESIERMSDFFCSLATKPDTEIEIVEKGKGEPDSCCVLCDNYIKEKNLCKLETAGPSEDHKDRIALRDLDLKIGASVKVEYALEGLGIYI